MNGLAAYRTPRYQSGGSISGSIGSLGGLNAPIDIGLGAFNPTPVGIAAALSPVGLGARTANAVLSAFNALSAMTQQQQEPAPVEEASVNTIADIAVSPVANPTAPVETAISAPMGLPGLAAMTEAEQAAQDQANVEAAPDSIAGALAAIASDPAAVAAVSDAVSTSTAGTTDSGGTTSDGGPSGPSGPSGVGDESGHTADGNNSGDSSTDSTGELRSGGVVKSYQSGGLAYYGNNMNSANFPMEMRYQSGGMTPVAQAVAGQGRMGDSMMVHMNPMEVAGLQALARSQGTSMTINPQTGMPEAFNLSSLLPLIAGVALGPAGMGLTAAQAGLAAGALGTVATGSLKKGLMAGLGAYGGAGLGEGLVGSAAAAPPPGMDGALGSGVTSTPTLPGAEATNPLSMQNVSMTGGPGGTGLTGGKFLNPETGLPFGPGEFSNQYAYGIPKVTPDFGLAGNSQSTAMGADALGGGLNIPKTTGFNPNLTAPLPAEQGFQIGASQGARALPPSTPGMFDNMAGKDILKYGSAAYSGTSALAQPEYAPPKSTAMLRPYTYKFNPVTGAYDRTPGDTSERLYGESTFTPGPVTQAAAGGLMSYMRETNFDDSDDMYAAGGLTAFKQGGKMERPKSRPLTGAAPYDFQGRDETMLQSVEKNFAKGGRFLVGDGDGMSDDIPAMIADKQPARLADGEFVIPADVVSHLGNGSSKAGAERLHDMMRKIRKERTGREKQAPAVKAEKFMPA